MERAGFVPTIDRLVSTALHWFRTDLSTVFAVFTTKSFRSLPVGQVKRLSARYRGSFSASNRPRQGEIFALTIDRCLFHRGKDS